VYLAPLQKYLYEIMNGDAELNTLVTGIHNDPEPQTPLPYIAFGDVRGDQSEVSTKLNLNMRVEQEIICYSQHGGHYEAKKVIDRIIELLWQNDGNIFNDEGNCIADVAATGAANIQTIRESDGKHFGCSVTIEFLVNGASS